MFKKILMTSIAGSLLLSLPVAADHHRHRHCDKVEEIIVEAKTKDKSTGSKIVGGLLQFINKTSPLISLAVALAVAYYGPFALKPNAYPDSKLIEGAVSGLTTFVLTRYGTAAAMSQEDIKPLKK